jgi:hypothetical protein
MRGVLEPKTHTYHKFKPYLTQSSAKKLLTKTLIALSILGCSGISKFSIDNLNVFIIGKALCNLLMVR